MKRLFFTILVAMTSFYVSAQTADELITGYKAWKTEMDSNPKKEILNPDSLTLMGYVLIGVFKNHYGLEWDACFESSVRVKQLKDKKLLLIDYHGNDHLFAPFFFFSGPHEYLTVDESDWVSFEEKMTFIKDKFLKWTQIALSNGERNFKKEIQINLGDVVRIRSLDLKTKTFKTIKTKILVLFEVDGLGHICLRFDDRFDAREAEMFNNHRPYLLFVDYDDFNTLYQIIKNRAKLFNDMKERVNQIEIAEKHKNEMYD